MQKLVRCLIVILLTAFAAPVHAQQQEKRVALVIGNSAYSGAALPTAANDAGLVAQTLQAAGFDVAGARDLDATTLRSSLREFVEKASASGPETVALVYFAGYGVQFEGENYVVPVDARIARDTDVPLEAIRVNDLIKPLTSLTLKARIIILDAGRPNKFATSDQPLAGGLALMQPDAETLIAFNAAPGTVGPDSKGPYGAYATALAEMIKAGGLPLDELFERVRLRVNDLTQGAELTWQSSRVQVPFLFFERTASAPPAARDRFAELGSKPIRDFDANDAYLAALARDTLRAYEDFLSSYPSDPLAKRVRAIIAARREAIVWRESALADTPNAYWSYLRRYPRGPHVVDAHRRLAHFAATLEPPPSFVAIAYDVPPPPPDEIVFIERPHLYFADPIYALPPPPPVPVIFLAPQPVYFLELPPPPPPIGIFVLPFPTYYPVPLWVERPSYVVQPPVNLISVNIHNTVVVNQVNNTVLVTNPAGQQVPPLPRQASPTNALQAHPGAAIAAMTVALPAAAALRNKQVPPTAAAPTTNPQQLRPGAPPASSPPVRAQSSTANTALPTKTPPSVTRRAGTRPLPASQVPATSVLEGQPGGGKPTTSGVPTPATKSVTTVSPGAVGPKTSRSPTTASRAGPSSARQSTPASPQIIQRQQQPPAAQKQAVQQSKPLMQAQRPQKPAPAARQPKPLPRAKGKP